MTRLRIPPFIATLGTFNILFALSQWFSENETLRNQDLKAQASILLWFDHTWEPIEGFRVTYGSLFMLALFVVAWYMLRRTAWGRHVYATGDDREAARLVGIRTNRVLMSVYLGSGLICGIAGWLWTSRIGTVSPKPLENANLDSITAVVIGGTSLFGGRGNVFGSLLGALIVGVFDSGLSQAGVEPLWRTFAIGVLVIVAVGDGPMDSEGRCMTSRGTVTTGRPATGRHGARRPRPDQALRAGHRPRRHRLRPLSRRGARRDR